MPETGTNLKELWGSTREYVEEQERQIVEKYIFFLREVAKKYLKEGRRMYFHENKVVHYAEGGFGSLLIEGEEDTHGISDEYVPEIRFEQKLDEKEIRRGYIEIKETNIGAIKYEIH